MKIITILGQIQLTGMCMKINICKFASLGLMHENLGAQKYLHLQQKDKTGVQRKPDTDQIVTYRYKFSKKEGLHLFCSTPGLNHSISMNIIVFYFLRGGRLRVTGTGSAMVVKSMC